MFDIGLGEFIALAVIALIVFGPDRLPKAAAQGGRALRQLREMAANARKELGDSAGLDTISDEWKSLQELHPKRIISSALEGPSDSAQAPKGGTAAPGSPPAAASGNAAVSGTASSAEPAAATHPAATQPAATQPGGPASASAGQTPPVPKASGYDPDAT